MVEPIPLRREGRRLRRPAQVAEDLSLVVARNLKRLRARHGHSLEKLAKRSGVSRAMLSQIELGRSVPTINVVFKIAQAFGLPFSALLVASEAGTARILRVSESKILASSSGAFSTRALFPFDSGRKTEFYELRLAAGATEDADAHPAGTRENLVVVQGQLEVEIGGVKSRLGPGDAILFHADQSHTYRNPSDEDALIYLVMTYADLPG
ncbi:MAG TPA: XRE family transcriptional regulator [Alphaproteobacteria bacterium]|nr:XRE family transcriptional regulator [Alphaproteobacteria bacterium]